MGKVSYCYCVSVVTTPHPYTTSIAFDRRLYKHDIAGSKAHARMLGRQGIVPESEVEAICKGLDAIEREIEAGAFPFREELEDIHMNVETRLAELIGEPAGRLHTARSRNDQVALDVRLFLREAIDDAISGLRSLSEALFSRRPRPTRMRSCPGTRTCSAPSPFLSRIICSPILRWPSGTLQRFQGLPPTRERTTPRAPGRWRGSHIPIDREFVARELGFDGVARNSMDAVSDRDFLVEFHAAAAIAMMHLSRLAEEMILWTSEEFGFASLAPEYTTGSSIMPQKRNPDVAELGRGKTGRVYGNLVALLTTLKALPLAYNKDMQEDKEGLFDTVDTLNATLAAFAGMVETMTINRERTRRTAEAGVYSGILATDLADYLVAKGLPFREAHGATKSLVIYAAERSTALNELSLEEYRRFSSLFEEDVFAITVESSLAARASQGGTAPERVKEALAQAREMLRSESA